MTPKSTNKCASFATSSDRLLHVHVTSHLCISCPSNCSKTTAITGGFGERAIRPFPLNFFCNLFRDEKFQQTARAFHYNIFIFAIPQNKLQIVLFICVESGLYLKNYALLSRLRFNAEIYKKNCFSFWGPPAHASSRL